MLKNKRLILFIFGSTGKQPVPPPRKKRGQHLYGESTYTPSVPSTTSPSPDSLTARIVKRSSSEEALSISEKSRPRKRSTSRGRNRDGQQPRVRRSASEVNRHGFILSLSGDEGDDEGAGHGDGYHKGPIPRSKSFMNVSGRYDIHEIFQEMKAKQLMSVDDVLKEILLGSKGRMSFSDMKPAYREMLLKLAFTMSKDEMYQKSKEIMRKHNRKTKGNMGGLMGVVGHGPANDSDTDASAISSVFRATKRSLSKFTSMRQKPSETRLDHPNFIQ
jgi:hypothetical protein